MTHSPEAYISVDVESSGPCPPLYSMLSIGACLVERPDCSFYRELQPIGTLAVVEAIEVVGKPLEYFASHGHRAETVMAEFEEWIREVADGGQPVFVGFNAAFDWAFVNYYCHTYLHQNPFGFAPIDIKAFFMGMLGTSWEDTRSSQIPGEFKGTTRQTHNALDDARAQAEMFKKMLVHQRRR